MDAEKLDGRWWRSVLFTAGHWDDLGDRLGATVADMVMLDLEDGVPEERKDDARAAVGRLARESWRPVLALRVNTPESGLIERDLDGALGPRIDAVILPKPRAAEDVRTLGVALGRREAALGMPEGTVRIVPLVETCAGALAAAELARASPRVLTLGIGASDFVADVGRPVTRSTLDPEALSLARRMLVLAARAAGLAGPFDGGRFPPGEAGWDDACEAVRRIGFQGKVCFDEAQAARANEVFAAREGERCAWD